MGNHFVKQKEDPRKIIVPPDVQIRGFPELEDVSRLEPVIEKLYQLARETELTITPMLKKLASKSNGKLVDLEHKFKDRSSVIRILLNYAGNDKYSIIQSLLEEPEKGVEQLLELYTSFEEKSKIIRDALRYKMIFPASKYSTGIIETLNKFQKDGYKEVSIQNYWQKGDTFQGIIGIFETPNTSFKFEIQFHTPESYDVKSKAHQYYCLFRVEKDIEKRNEYFKQSIEIFTNTDIAVPEGALEIGNLSNQPLDEMYDMWAMKLYDQAVQIEPKVTEVMKKLFPDKLYGLDNRIKLVPSISRRIRKIYQRTEIDIKEAITQVEDPLRYTLVAETKEYIPFIKDAIDQLKKQGFTLIKIHNWWADNDAYEGLHVTFQTPTEVNFEIQFHTPETYKIKEEKLNQLFEKYEDEKFLPRRKELYEEIVKLWKSVEVPENAQDLKVLLETNQ